MSEQTGSWQPDPFGRHQYRYWDGAQWTDQVANDGAVSTDPPVADAGTGPASEPTPAGDEATASTEAEPAEPGPGEPAQTEAAPTEPVAAVPPVAGAEPIPPAQPIAPAEPIGTQPPPPDATTTMAAAPPAGGEPAPAAADGGGKGPNVALVIIVVVVLAALVGAAVWYFFLRDDDGDTEELRTEAVASLRSELGLTSAQANCVVDELDDSVGLGALRDAVERDDLTPAQSRALDDAFDECGVSPRATDTDSATDTTLGPDDDDDSADPGNIAFPPALMAMMAQELADETGISVTQAECVMTGIFSRFTDDNFASLLTDPDALDFDSMLSAMEVFEECGVDPNDLDSGGFDDFDDDFDFDFGPQSGDTYGDNPVLDSLWDACGDGDMESCDELYWSTGVGTEYEEFGSTCGGRGPKQNGYCATS